MKLFDYFIIEPSNKNGTTIKVKSTLLEKFYNENNVEFNTLANNWKISYYEELIPDRFVRNALEFHFEPRYKTNNSRPDFLSDSSPYMGFLTMNGIGHGIEISIKAPITKSEFSLYFKKMFEYSVRLKTQIENAIEKKAKKQKEKNQLNSHVNLFERVCYAGLRQNEVNTL